MKKKIKKIKKKKGNNTIKTSIKIRAEVKDIKNLVGCIYNN